MVIQFTKLNPQISPKYTIDYAQLFPYFVAVGPALASTTVYDVYMPALESTLEWASGFPEAYFARCFTGWYWYEMGSEQIWNSLLDRIYLYEAATSDEVIKLGYVNCNVHFTIGQALNCWDQGSLDLETALELEVAKRFQEIPRVQSIYTDEYQNRKRFLFLTSNEKYDDLLMDQFLSIERELRLSHTETPASFVYIPRLLESAHEIVPKASKLIYEREYDVIIARSLMASETQRETSHAASK